jgi:hypothetical protein
MNITPAREIVTQVIAAGRLREAMSAPGRVDIAMSALSSAIHHTGHYHGGNESADDQARRRMRTESGGYRRDHLRALAQRIEVDAKEVRIMGSKSELLRTLVAASSAKTAGFGVPSSVPKWRTRRETNIMKLCRFYKGFFSLAGARVCSRVCLSVQEGKFGQFFKPTPTRLSPLRLPPPASLPVRRIDRAGSVTGRINVPARRQLTGKAASSVVGTQ